jgi:hypothetical protein
MVVISEKVHGSSANNSAFFAVTRPADSVGVHSRSPSRWQERTASQHRSRVPASATGRQDSSAERTSPIHWPSAGGGLRAGWSAASSVRSTLYSGVPSAFCGSYRWNFPQVGHSIRTCRVPFENVCQVVRNVVPRQCPQVSPRSAGVAGEGAKFDGVVFRRNHRWQLKV